MIIAISILFLFSSCKQTFVDENEKLNPENVEKIIFSKRIETQCDSFEPFEINDKKLIEKFVRNINNSTSEGVWKGTCSSDIKMIINDTFLSFLTFDEVFSHSGKWYRYPDKDILEKLRKENIRLTTKPKTN